MEATESLSLLEAVRSLGTQPTAILQNGRPVAVLLPTQGADLETIAVSLSPQFHEIMERSAIRLHTEGGISSDEMRRRLGIVDPSGQKAKRNGRKPAPKRS